MQTLVFKPESLFSESKNTQYDIFYVFATNL